MKTQRSLAQGWEVETLVHDELYLWQLWAVGWIYGDLLGGIGGAQVTRTGNPQEYE